MELNPDQLNKIKDILSKEFEMSPYYRAATKIIQAGLSSEHLYAFAKTATGKAINSAEVWNTYNEIKNIESGIKHK